MYDSVGVVYVPYPCCVCTTGEYYTFSVAEGLTLIPINAGNSVFDPRTGNWIDVEQLGTVTIFNILSGATTTYTLTYQVYQWQTVAIAIPATFACASLIAFVAYGLYIFRSKLFRLSQSFTKPPSAIRTATAPQVTPSARQEDGGVVMEV